MSRVFIDSNIWLYSFIDTGHKTQRSKDILLNEKDIVLSVQVINEVCFNLLKKVKFTEVQIKNLSNDYYLNYDVVNFSNLSLKLASEIR